MHANRLSKESSPYLLQHAHNPVDWFPWGKEALEKARAENKPILVSIGYSACHWCHVMERESFENEQIATLMNEIFVCIKVDREERPDVDAIYMDSLQAMGVRGGWPLNVFLMPDAKPFYGGTYFPPQNWVNLLKSIKRAFEQQREELQKSADGFTENMLFKESDKYGLSSDDAFFTTDDMDTLYELLSKDFDFKDGGMQRSPKFPMPSIWLFLMRYISIKVLSSGEDLGEAKAINQLSNTLDRIALGGIFDHLGGGWTRYSTDNIWKVPHFEKMLYDNGQLLSLYSEAFCLLNSKQIKPESAKLYQWAVYQTVDWLEREILSPEGGFYSAQDADSEGEEGKFYVWSEEELEKLLGEDAAWFADLYDITDAGNWEHGNNILHLEQIPDSETWNKLKNIHQKLFNYRANRIKPGLDNKILCSWNGLMLKGLVDAYRYFNEPKFIELSIKNAHYIQENLTNKDAENTRSLWHSVNKNTKITGFLEDYAAIIDAYISLYQVTFDEKWLSEASMLMDYALTNFFDKEDEFFYFTDSEGEALIARKKEMFDNVIPASNSIMANNLYKLGILIGNDNWIALSKTMLSKIKSLLLKDPQWLTNWAILASNLANPTAEVALVGNEIEQFRAEIDKKYRPNKLFVGTKTSSELPLLQERTAINGKTTIYVCFDKTCQLPVTNLNEIKI